MKAKKTGLSVEKVKKFVDGFFPLKTFCLFLALFLFLFLGTIGVYQLIFKPPAPDLTLTGKTIGTMETTHKVDDQPIETAPEEKTEDPPKEIPKAEEHADTAETPAEPAHETKHADASHEATHEDAGHETPETEAKHDAPATDEKPSVTAVEDSIAGLTEQSPSGYLPVTRPDGMKSFEAYKAPFKLNANTKGVISLVMVDYGLSDNLSKAAVLNLPAATTFVASPYSSNLQAKISGARARGMEVWMALPIQGTDNSAPTNMGPNTILSGLNSKENMNRLNAHMGRATGYVGMAIDVTPSFDKTSPELRSVINNLSARGLGVTQLVPNDNFISMIAAQTNTPYINGDLWIDTVLAKDDILAALANAEKTALANGHAVASFNPSLLVNTTIADWQKSLAAKNIQLAPLTYSAHMAIDTPTKTAAVAEEKPAEAVAPEKKEEPKTEAPKIETVKTETASHGTKH